MRLQTPPPALYNAASWPTLVDRVLARTWHVVATVDELALPGSVVPVTLLPGVLDEPILLVREGEAGAGSVPAGSEGGSAANETRTGGVRAYVNVCTHRSARLVAKKGVSTSIRCPYHGRRFGLDGQCQGAPGFTSLDQGDHLAPVAVAVWGPLIFVSIAPAMPFDALFPREQLDAWWNPLAEADPAGSAVYPVEANFLLWCENFLEGLHIPFVHPALNRAIDWKSYQTSLHGWSSLQLARPSVPGPTLRAGGQDVAGAYVALFPTTALNFYPWGLSLNIVEPLSPSRTNIRYKRWVHRPELLHVGAGAGLDAVEAEDDAIVAEVQAGLRSRLARPGRYAGDWEAGVAHFHDGVERLFAD